MTVLIKLLAMATTIALLAAAASAQSAREVRGPTPLLAIPNDAPPKLVINARYAEAKVAELRPWFEY